MRWIAIFITLIQFGCVNVSAERATVNVDTAALLAAANMESTTAGGDRAGTLLAVSPEIRAFVDSIDPDLTPNQRFRRILRTLKMDRFELEYDLNHTTTAAEAFALRRGNCISFAALMVALAREVGLEAHFNLVEAPLERSAIKSGNGRTLVQNILHINAEVSFGWSTQVIEFNFDPSANFPHRRLADATVATHFLNNRALELSRKQQMEDAFALLHEALTIDPEASLLWNSLGYLYRLRGELELAEMSYTQALSLQPGNTAAQNNLRRVYELKDLRALTRGDNVGASGRQGS